MLCFEPRLYDNVVHVNHDQNVRNSDCHTWLGNARESLTNTNYVPFFTPLCLPQEVENEEVILIFTISESDSNMDTQRPEKVEIFHEENPICEGL